MTGRITDVPGVRVGHRTLKQGDMVLAQMLPADIGTAHETLRRCTFKAAEELPMLAAVWPTSW